VNNLAKLFVICFLFITLWFVDIEFTQIALLITFVSYMVIYKKISLPYILNYIIFAVTLSIVLIVDNTLLSAGVVVITSVVIALNYKLNVNAALICLIVFVLRAIDTTFLEVAIPIAQESMSSFWVNNIGFFTALVIDILFCVCLIYRASISRAIISRFNKSYEGIYITQTDIALLSVSIINIAWDFLGTAENFMRHLDEIGFSTETAQKFYDWNWIYYHFSEGKTILGGLMFFLLLIMLTNSKNKVKNISLDVEKSKMY